MYYVYSRRELTNISNVILNLIITKVMLSFPKCSRDNVTLCDKHVFSWLLLQKKIRWSFILSRALWQ